MKHWGLWGRLTWVLAIMALAATGFTGFYIHHSSQRLLIDLAQDSLLTSTQVLARRLVTVEREVSRNLALLAEHPASAAMLQRQDASAREQVGRLFELLMAHNPAYLQVRLIRAAGGGMEVARVDRDGSGWRRLPEERLQNMGADPYVATALAQPARATFLSRLSIHPTAGLPAGQGRPTLQLAMPVMNASSQAIGLVVIQMDLDAAFQTLAEDLPAGVHLYMANDAGDILIHPDGSKTFGFDKGRRWLLQDPPDPDLDRRHA